MATKDRFNEMQSMHRKASRKISFGANLIMDPMTEKSDSINAFYQEVEELSPALNSMATEIQMMKREQSELLSSPTVDSSVARSLDARTSDIRNKAKAFKVRSDTA